MIQGKYIIMDCNCIFPNTCTATDHISRAREFCRPHQPIMDKMSQDTHIEIYCNGSECSDILYRCHYPNCNKFMCNKCIEKDAVVYYTNKQKKIICPDCLPYVAINMQTNTIRLYRIKNTQEVKTEPSRIKWITKHGFSPLSSKVGVFAVVAAIVASTSAIVASTSSL
jgi:hypothetical protein